MPNDLQATDLNPIWLERLRARPTAAGTPPQVLLVYEDRNLRELMKLYLVAAGYMVTGIGHPGDIDRELARRPTDLVVVDMSLPYIDGIEFSVREPDGGLIPVMFLTADEHTRARAERLGAIACLTQPLYADLYLAAVARALRERGTQGMRAGLRPPRSAQHAA